MKVMFNNQQDTQKAMKTNRLTFTRNPFRVRGFRSRTAALIASLAISACTAVRLDAVVIDDFENGVKFAEGGGGTNYFLWGLTNGQLGISKQNPIATPTGNLPETYDNVYWPAPQLPAGNLDEGRTLELRLDLNHASADNLFLVLMCGGPSDGADSAYAVFVDRNEVALAKWKPNAGMNTFYWDTAATTNENVTVKVAFTKTNNNSLAITVKVVDKGNQRATLYNRTFVDGPGRDGPVPPPDPHGIGVLIPDPGGPLTNFTYAAAGCWQMIFTSPPPLEMLLDNLEYDVYHSPHLEIAQTSNGVALSWMLPMEEQILVEADLLSGPWRPCPIPPSLTGGTLCVESPCLAQQNFYKLVLGTRFSDDFSGTKPPWLPCFFEDEDTNRWALTETNGVFRVQALAAPADPGGRMAIFPPGPWVEFKDFWASIDILDLHASLDARVGIIARFGGDPGNCPGNNNGYIAALRPNWEGVKNRAILAFARPPDPLITGPVFTFKPGTPYRLIFSGVGQQFSVELIDLESGQPAVAPLLVTKSVISQGATCLWISSQGDPGFDVTFDNFFITRTKP